MWKYDSLHKDYESTEIPQIRVICGNYTVLLEMFTYTFQYLIDNLPSSKSTSPTLD